MAVQIVLDFESKFCRGCNSELPLQYFTWRTKRGKRVRRSRCRECERKTHKCYYSKNREHLRRIGREAARIWRAQDPEHAKALLKTWKARNPDKVKESHRKTVAKRPEWYKQSAIRRDRRYYQRHPDRVKAKAHRRRLAKSKGTFSAEQWRWKCEYWGWRCYLCGLALDITTATIDHRKSLLHGGCNWPANLAPACARCNAAKREKSEADFRRLLASRK